MTVSANTTPAFTRAIDALVAEHWNRSEAEAACAIVFRKGLQVMQIVRRAKATRPEAGAANPADPFAHLPNPAEVDLFCTIGQKGRTFQVTSWEEALAAWTKTKRGCIVPSFTITDTTQRVVARIDRTGAIIAMAAAD